MEFGREFITLFDRVQIRYYGIIIVLAMLVAATMAARLAKRDRRDPDHVWGALTWAIIPAIIGARLWFVLFPTAALVAQGQDTAWYIQNFFNPENGAIAIWSGGLSIFGAVLGGFLGAYLYFSRWHNPIGRFFSSFWWLFIGILGVIAVVLGANNAATWAIVLGVILLVIVVLWLIPPTRRILRRFFGEGEGERFPENGLAMAPWLDIAGVCLPLGQAIGRWANYINQELYGLPTTLPWGIEIEGAKRVGDFKSLVDFPVATTRFHPLFLYESIWNFLAFVVLLNLFLRNRQNFRPGDFFLIYVMQYAFIRFLLEFIRVETTIIGGVNFSQVVSAVVFIVALIIFVMRRRSAPNSAQSEASA
ncbi:MAG: prolipoprotein diacylglyceryl transferase [Anaerolineae bacterium]|nr:prolipoprotein diacylglyceryl transferase [Anaerolineae bacterium]